MVILAVFNWSYAISPGTKDRSMSTHFDSLLILRSAKSNNAQKICVSNNSPVNLTISTFKDTHDSRGVDETGLEAVTRRESKSEQLRSYNWISLITTKDVRSMRLVHSSQTFQILLRINELKCAVT